jgi:hypothetical protein
MVLSLSFCRQQQDEKKLPGHGWFVHAPCTISNVREDKDSVRLTVDGWDDKQCYVLISGVQTEPREIVVNPDKLHTPCSRNAI